MLPGHKYTIEDVLGILWRGKWLVLVPLVVCAAGAYEVARHMPDMYKSETLILIVPQKVPEEYVRSTVSGTIEDRLQSLKEQILSRSRLEKIVVDLDLYRDARKTRSIDSVVETMRSAVSVEMVRGGEAFTVSYAARDALVAKNVTERLASMFIQQNITDRETLAFGTSEFLQTQLDHARQQLEEQERKVEQYRLEHAGQLPTQAPFNLEAIQTDRSQLEALDVTLAGYRDRRATLERELADLLAVPSPAQPLSARGQAEPTPAASDGDVLTLTGDTLADQLADGRRKLAALEGRGFKPDYPDIVTLRRRIAALEALGPTAPRSKPAVAPPMTLDPVRAQRARELGLEIDSVKREIASSEEQERKLQGEIADYQGKLDAMPVREAELTALTRDYETIQQIYRGLLTKREDSQVAANLEQRQVGQQFRILDHARMAQTPFSPNRTRIDLAGIAGGAILGLGLLGLLEYRDTTLKTEDDVRSVLDLPVIATIPVLPDLAQTPRPLRARVAAVLRGSS